MNVQTIEYIVGCSDWVWYCHGPDYDKVKYPIIAYADNEADAIIEYVKAYINQKHS